MPATNSDCLLTEATVMPLDFTTATVGGTKTSNALSGAPGAVFFPMEANPLAGGVLEQNLKFFGFNANSVDSIYNAKFWIRNSLDLMLANAQLVLWSNSALDDSTRKVRIMGYDDLGAAAQEEVPLNGLTAVSSSTVWSAIHRLEVRDALGALVSAWGQITAQSTVGPTVLGYIPVGKTSATGELDIGLENTQDGSQTIATAAAVPATVTYFRPRTMLTGLVAIGGTILPLGGQGIWGRWRLPELAKPSLEAQGVFVFSGSAA